MSKLVKLFVMLVLLAGLGTWGGEAMARACTSAVVTGNWNTTGTWSCVGGNRVPTTNDSVTIAVGNTITVDATTANVQSVTVNGTLTQSRTLNDAGTLTVAGTLTSSSTMTIDGATTVTGDLNITSTSGSRTFTGAVTVTGGTWNNSANEAVTFGGGITNDGTFTAGTGTQTFSANQTIDGGNPINFAGQVTVASNHTVNNNNTSVVTITGNLTGGNSSSTWVNGANSTLNYGGGSNPMGSGVFTASAVNTVNYNGAGQTVDATTYYNLTLSGNGTKAMPATATVTHDFIISSGAAVTAGAALTVGGNWTELGSFAQGAGTVTLNSAGAQTISGINPVTFNNLTVSAANPNITLLTNVTVATLTGTVRLTPSCPNHTLTSTNPNQTLQSCPAPTITGISPTSGPTAGGTTVTINGNNFTGLTGASAVKFGSVNATSYIVNSATQITATAPAGSAGTVDITVTTPGGTSATSTADQFTYMAAPTITGITPNNGPVAGATVVIITGTSFTGATAVKFGSNNATSYTFNSDTQITATAPPGADTVDVTVTTPGGTSATSAADQFTYMPALFAQYLMDESGWNGTASEVKDSAGSNHGTAATLTTPLPTTANTTPAIAGSPGTCRYGVFDRTKKNYVALPASFPNLGASTGTNTSFTITAWIRTTDNTLGAQRVFIDDELQTQGYGVSLGEGGTGMLRFYTRGTPSVTILDTPNVIASNAWYFVAAVADLPNKLKRIYVYDTTGALLANVSATWTEANFGTGDAGIASIGGETNSAAASENANAFGFAGNIDEARVYQSALSSFQVNLVRQIARACVPSLDHLRIKHDGEGSTCAAENITVEACADPQCNALVTTGGITATLQPFGTAVSIGTSGSQTLSVSLSTAGTNTLNATSINPAPANTTVSCLNTVTSIASCTMLVSACPGGSNFNCLETSITPYSSGTANLYTKLAGTAFSFDVVALNSSGAVETNYVVTGATAKNVTVELFDDSTSPQPATCSAYASPLASQTLSFVSTTGRNTTASFTVPNAYRKLRCRVTDANMAPTAYGCSSDDFSVRPSAATLLTSATAVAPSAASTPVIKAGANFTLGATTAASANYSGTLTLDSGKLTAQITSQGSTQQSGGVVGTLTPSSLTANATAVNATYSEVGYLYLAPGAYRDDTFTAVDSTTGDCITSTVSDANLADTLSGGKYGCSIGSKTTVSFGRFIPDHFDVSVNANGTMAAACLAGGFTYTGQAMSYVGTTLPSLTIMPMSAASGGHVTQNYQGVFQKLAASGVSITSPTADATQLGKDGATKTALAATMSAGTLANSSGTLTYTLKSDDTFTYTRDANALVGPYTSSSPLAVTAVADGEAAAAGTLPTLSPTGVSLRFGRLRLQNAYGSERLPLAVPLQAQYWAGSAFTNNTNDSCTVVSVPAPRTLTGSAVPDGQPNLYFYPPVTGKNELTDAVPTLTSPLSGGKSNLQFAAPLKRGWLDVILNVPNYLIYNWGNCSGQTGTAGLLDDFPCARATFGIYGAKSPIIYRRENY